MSFQQEERSREALLAFLEARGIKYVEEEHAAVFTMAESMQLKLSVDGWRCKNLLVKNKKNTERFLVITTPDAAVDLGALGRNLGVGRLTFCTPDDMVSLLGVGPGSASPLALLADQMAKKVRVLMDSELEHVDTYLFHPFVNTATLQIGREGLLQFLAAVEHILEVVPVPKRS